MVACHEARLGQAVRVRDLRSEGDGLGVHHPGDGLARGEFVIRGAHERVLDA